MSIYSDESTDIGSVGNRTRNPLSIIGKSQLIDYR